MRNDLCGDWCESNHDASDSRNFISRNFHSRLFRLIPSYIWHLSYIMFCYTCAPRAFGPLSLPKKVVMCRKNSTWCSPKKGNLWNAKSHFRRFRKFYFYDHFGAECKREKRANISNIIEQWTRKKKISYANFLRVFTRVAGWRHKWQTLSLNGFVRVP